ncbi:MAG: peptide chain release factor N(5)-glutamine methyltransferase [Janthinobacterium lividum]
MTQRMASDLLAEAEYALADAGIDQPRREARWLLAHALGLQVAGLLGLGRHALVEADRFVDLVRQRSARMPLAYLTGQQGFWTLDLAVSDATLIPRADSETLIEALLQARQDRGQVHRILDLGTGTGCLLLAALAEYPQAWGIGVDLSEAAARLASRNAAGNALADRSAFLCGDWADAVGLSGGRFDVILSNPPYIPHNDIATLMPEVAAHEPMQALDGGADGLAAYRLLMPILARLLAPAGLAVLEIGIGQAIDVSRLGAEAGLATVAVRPDLGGVDRAVLLTRPL